MQDLENEYRIFCKLYTEIENENDVEYLGLNLTDKVEDPVNFKVYYTTTKSLKETAPFLQQIKKRNMIHALNRIDDVINKGLVRYEVGLSNRTNDNMKWLYNWVFDIYPALSVHKDELKRLTALKCCGQKDYELASLYYLGFIADCSNPFDTVIKAAKFHYLLRYCDNPEKIGKNYVVDTEKFLNVLRKTSSKMFAELADAVKYLVDACHAELWMAAVDYYLDGTAKYKIYIKKFDETIYDALINYLKKWNNDLLITRIDRYRNWIVLHPELERYGLALCMTNAGNLSINFYH